MQQAPAVFGETVPNAEVAALLGIVPADLHASLRPQMVSTGLKDLMVPVKDKQVLSRLRPQTEEIKAFSKAHDSYSLHVFALLAGDSLAAARNFDPAHGIPEECATGTSNGGLLCYLGQNNMLPASEMYRIEQGEAMGELSYIYGKFVGDTVWIGGNATAMDVLPVVV
ncbi:MAG TPA: PhzF family phenazine biosynthesis protein [Candidatus Saccharimonadales bacterium]|nr:PhzF family phenazine biosynthesis protein [Candidatus Saccharimonadales bacterium]